MSEPTNDALRLNKQLALRMGISRREADELISRGHVTINGETATLGARMSEHDKLSVDGESVSSRDSYTYIAFHKPVGYVCSRRAQGDLPTIYELLPPALQELKTVGRLDFNSSGILLLTNDGDFTFQMTHPKFAKKKIYKVRLDRDLEPLHQQMISDYGVSLEDGTSLLTLERLSDGDRTEWQVTMSEGRNRQIRRTFASLGYEVKRLHRINFGNYALGDIKPGTYETVDIR